MIFSDRATLVKKNLASPKAQGPGDGAVMNARVHPGRGDFKRGGRTKRLAADLAPCMTYSRATPPRSRLRAWR